MKGTIEWYFNNPDPFKVMEQMKEALLSLKALLKKHSCTYLPQHVRADGRILGKPFENSHESAKETYLPTVDVSGALWPIADDTFERYGALPVFSENGIFCPTSALATMKSDIALHKRSLWYMHLPAAVLDGMAEQPDPLDEGAAMWVETYTQNGGQTETPLTDTVFFQIYGSRIVMDYGSGLSFDPDRVSDESRPLADFFAQAYAWAKEHSAEKDETQNTVSFVFR